jgi:hypothetical protein
MRVVREGYRLERPSHCDRSLYNIMSYCWEAEPQDRITFAQLVDRCEELLMEEADYIDLNMFPEHEYYNAAMSISDEKV